jgi:hypothetical protein
MRRIHIILIIFSLLVAGAASYKDYSSSSKLYFAIDLKTSLASTSQIFPDIGNGYTEEDGKSLTISPLEDFSKYKFRLPRGNIKSIRFDPTVVSSTIEIRNARIENRKGVVIKQFPINAFVPYQQIDEIELKNDILILHIAKNANDPILIIENSSFDSNYGWKTFFAENGWQLAIYSLFSFVFFMGLTKLINNYAVWCFVEARAQRLANISIVNPRKAIIVIGLIAAIASCYPVIFSGKTFVSPVGSSLYAGTPFVPGFQFDGDLEHFRGSDLGAMVWSFAPNSVVQHDSILRDFEFPFWSRYVGLGVPLYGQGQSMIGDVLHWIPVLLNGSAVGWDLKFILSKLIFAVGMGLLVFRLTGNLVAGSLIAISSCFLGFFAFRFNHPAYFVLTYVPWVLLQWDHFGKTLALPQPKIKDCALQGLLLAAVIWLALNAGAVKESVILALFIQTLGMLFFMAHLYRKWGGGKSFVLACWVGFAIVMVAAPYWLIFLDTLSKSYTGYDTPKIVPLPLWGIVGFFDNIFTQASFNGLTGPSVNLFTLLCMSSALISLRFRQSVIVYGTWGLFGLAMSIAYGLFPSSILIAIPLVRNIIHTGDVFSMPMIILSLIIAGYGIKDYLMATKEKQKLILYFSVLLFFVMSLALIFKTENRIDVLKYIALFSLVIIIGFIQLFRQTEEEHWRNSLLAVLVCCFLFSFFHIRHGLHLKTGIKSIDSVVTNPMKRANLSEKSEAIEYVKNRMKETGLPTRVIGEGEVLFPGYNSRYGLEGIVTVEAVRNKYQENLLTLVDYPLANNWGWLRLIKSDQVVNRAVSLDLMGIGYMVARVGTPMPQGMKLLHSSDLDVWQRESVWPRAFFVNRVVDVHKPSEILDAMADKLHTPFAAMESQFIPHGILNNTTQFQAVPARDYKLTNNSTHFTVDASGPGIIVLSETYYPGDFIAKVNAKEVDYVRVNEAFKGVWVNKAGKYEVSFTYRPEKLGLSMLMSIFGLILLLTIIVSICRSNRRLSVSLHPTLF